MRRRLAALAAALFVFVALLATVSPAFATPTRSGSCGGCHSPNTAIVVKATQTSNDGVNAVYAVTVSNPYNDGVASWAVFNASTKVSAAMGSSANVTVAVGKTYTVWGVSGKTGRGANSITISPSAAPPPPPPPGTTDTVAPVVTITSPTNGASVSGTVLLAATAADAGSGMSRVEFRVDGALVGTAYPPTYTATWNASSATPGTHVIEARAYDLAGNSAATSVSVTIVIATPPPAATGSFTNNFSAGETLNTTYLEAVGTGSGTASVGGGALTLTSPVASSTSVLSFRNAVSKTAASTYSATWRVTGIADGSSVSLLGMHAGSSRVTANPTRYLDASFVRAGAAYGLQLAMADSAGTTKYYNWSNATWSTSPARLGVQPNVVYTVRFEVNSSRQFRYVACNQAGTPLVNGTTPWTNFSAVYNDVADNYWPYLGDASTTGSSGTMQVLSVTGPAPSGGTPADTTAPSVSISSPANGATVSGSVPVAVSASDTGSGVARVEVRADGMLVGTDTSAPYTATWNATGAAAGAHTITATAVDVAGNSASASVQVNVPAPPDTTAPTVAITSPANGATVSGSVGLAASASDTGSGVSRVEFRVDGVLVGTDTSAPYTATWNASGAAAGTHTVTATAVDGAGNSASSSVTVGVVVPDTTPPTVSLTSPASGATVSGSVALAASAADAGSGVSRVEFRVDGVLVGTDTSAPYTATWNASGASAGTHTVSATAVDGAGNSASSSVTVSIAAPADTTPPAVAITSPAPGATITGAVTIAASGSDAGSGMARVDFTVDGVVVFSDTSAPYSVAWDPSAYAAGAHTISARGYDLAGNSSSASIQVNYSPPAPPPASSGTFTNDFSAGEALNTSFLETVFTGGGSANLGGGVLSLASPLPTSTSFLSFRNAVPEAAVSSYSVKFRVTDIADGSAIGLLATNASPTRTTGTPTGYLDASFVRSGVTQGLQVRRTGADGTVTYYNWANATWGPTAARLSLQLNTVYIVKLETSASGQFRWVACNQAGSALVNGTSPWTSFSSVYGNATNDYWPYVGDANPATSSGTIQLLSVSGQ